MSSKFSNYTLLHESLQDVSDALQVRMEELLPAVGGSQQTTVISLSERESTPASHVVKGEEKVVEAMRYAALSGGKRLRPFLCVTCANLFGVSSSASLSTAVAIEMVHSYSLVHDDLPAMDDDDLRRGQPSCHIVFGEAAAILAGDGLQALAFEILADPSVHADPSVRCELIRSLARAAGCRGMVGGQMMDLEAERDTLSVDEIIRLQRLKTGEMFAISCEAGAILGKAPKAMRQALRRYAHDMGTAFQITDDLLDVEGTREEMGKAVNKDKIAGKATLVQALGIERAREHAEILAAQAKEHLHCFDKKADALRMLADYVVNRRV